LLANQIAEDAARWRSILGCKRATRRHNRDVAGVGPKAKQRS
jgi:hypothetical protein